MNTFFRYSGPAYGYANRMCECVRIFIIYYLVSASECKVLFEWERQFYRIRMGITESTKYWFLRSIFRKSILNLVWYGIPYTYTCDVIIQHAKTIEHLRAPIQTDNDNLLMGVLCDTQVSRLNCNKKCIIFCRKTNACLLSPISIIFVSD